MGVLLVDLDDTLIPDTAARDQAMSSALGGSAAMTPLSEVWPVVRGQWQASGLRRVPALAGVSSWEALWTDFRAAVADPVMQLAGRDYQVKVWDRLLPGVDAATASARFRAIRQELVHPFEWVPGALTRWVMTHELWCVTNGSSWLQRHKLLLAGLAPVFGEVVVSGEVGVEKSERRFHDEVAARLTRGGVAPVAVIGDSASSDGVLAAALGVRHVQVQVGANPSGDLESVLSP